MEFVVSIFTGVYLESDARKAACFGVRNENKVVQT